jgi:hypothetical protein
MASPPSDERMAYKSNLELFGPIALAFLMDGPKPQTALDGHVPVSVLDHLTTAGMVKRKMLRHGSMATAWWYMADEGAPSLPDTSAKALPRCDDPGILDSLQMQSPCRIALAGTMLRESQFSSESSKDVRVGPE